ncbi:MAG: hypothetical protein EOM67_05485 [Spirochaetia bacterium]|nr:hypothetical protein [Spirochaetia bacterium]
MSISIADKQIELDRAKSKYLLFSDAEDRVVRGGQSMTIDDGDMRRTVSRVDVKWLSERTSYWKNEVFRLTKEIENMGRKGRSGIYVRLS